MGTPPAKFPLHLFGRKGLRCPNPAPSKGNGTVWWFRPNMIHCQWREYMPPFLKWMDFHRFMLLAGKKWGEWLFCSNKLQESNEMLKGGRRGEIRLRKPQTSWFCKKRAPAVLSTAALDEAAGTTSEMHFSCILKEPSSFWVKGLACDSFSALYLQVSFEIFGWMTATPQALSPEQIGGLLFLTPVCPK